MGLPDQQQFSEGFLLNQFSAYFEVSDCRVKEVEYIKGLVYGSYVSNVLIIGHSLQMLMRLHFVHDDGKNLIINKWAALGDDPEEITDNDLFEEMNEYLNTVAGMLRGGLRDKETVQSLPYITLGVQEVFSRVGIGFEYKLWEVYHNNTPFYFEVSFKNIEYDRILEAAQNIPVNTADGMF